MTRKVVKIPTEYQEQMTLAVWLTKRGIKFFAIPNGGSRNLLEAIKLKRTGVQPGVPDIFVPIPSGQYHGLFLEMKRKKGGVLSDQQVQWLDFLEGKGYYVECAFGFEHAQEVVMRYLAFNPIAA